MTWGCREIFQDRVKKITSVIDHTAGNVALHRLAFSSIAALFIRYKYSSQPSSGGLDVAALPLGKATAKNPEEGDNNRFLDPALTEYDNGLTGDFLVSRNLKGL